MIETALNTELSDHLGYEKHQPKKGSNSRNGFSSKTITTQDGQLALDIPRDREGSFEPQIIVKLLYYSYKIRKTRNNSSTESINHSLRLRLTHAHICSIGFKSGLYAGSQRILCPCCSNNS